MSYPWQPARRRFFSARHRERQSYPTRPVFWKRSLLSRWVSALIGAASLAPAVPASAAPPVNALPVPGAQFVTPGSGRVDAPAVAGSNMTITQHSQKAILNWQSFDIGRDAGVRFDQRAGSSSATLNRIGGGKPSEIHGKLSANGSVILINQNGVVFGAGAQVNVRGLVASSLETTDERFLEGLRPERIAEAVYTWNGDQAGYEAAADAAGNGVVRVEPGAHIATSEGGSVTLLAPRVENAGTIETPGGQILLAAGDKVYLDFSEDSSLRGLLVEVDPFDGQDTQGNPVKLGGVVTNASVGELIAKRGNITMAGFAVNQLGRVSATTSVRVNGSIILKARDGAIQEINSEQKTVLVGAKRFGELTLGPDSRTEILPELNDDATSTDAQTFVPSSVKLSGRTIHLKENSQIVAPGGDVELVATEIAQREGGGIPFESLDSAIADTSRILLDTGAVIDVSGTDEYAVPIERNFVSFIVLGDELKDVPGQRDGVLYRKEVWIDVRRRPTVVNADGYIAQVGRTVGERTATGGTVRLIAPGEVILGEGSRVDVSGGSVRYLDGYGRTTSLVTADGKVFDIADAPADLAYTGIVGVHTVRTRWGERQWIVPSAGSSARYLTGHIEGKDAGTIEIASHAAALDGELRGGITAGPYQRDALTRPLAGLLQIGYDDLLDGNIVNHWLSDVRIGDERVRLANFDPSQPLPDEWKKELPLSTELIEDGEFGRIKVFSNGQITLDADAALALPAGGELSLTGREIVVDGDIHGQGARVNLKTEVNNRLNLDAAAAVDPARFGIRIGSGSEISVNGRWVNDRPDLTPDLASPVFIDGGVVRAQSIADLDVAGTIDVSGGAWADARGKIHAGDAGSITLETGRFLLGDSTTSQVSQLLLTGELRGYAIAGGGTLTLDTSAVRIANSPVAAATDPVLNLGSDFFNRGGFRDFTIAGDNGVSVESGASIRPRVQNYMLDSNALLTPGAGSLAFATFGVLPVERRAPAHITLKADNPGSADTQLGHVVVGAGARIETDPGGEIVLIAGRQLTVEGELIAPAGQIDLTLKKSDVYRDNASLWIGADARLSATGSVRREPNDLNLSLGEVLNGGDITLDAAGGYLVTEAGSVIDVSGASATLDLLPPAGFGATPTRQTVASDAGSLTLTAREGMLLDGAIAGQPGGRGARGGEITVSLDGLGRFQHPNTASRLVLRQGGEQDGASLPPGLRPGDVIESFADANDPARNQFNGKAFVNANDIMAGGFDAVTLQSHQRIEFDGSVALQAARRITLDAPVIAAANAVAVTVAAPYVALANSGFEPPVAAAADGNATFTANAKVIDLRGRTGLDGFAQFTLNADDDVRLAGRYLPTISKEKLIGELSGRANITIRADQIYPTTLTDFTIRVTDNPDGTLTILPGDAGTPVLSAAGRVTLSAPEIEMDGTLKAPFGEIILGDVLTNNVHVSDGALLSVSGEGQTVPFGHTLVAQTKWVYELDSGAGAIVSVDSPAEKRVVMSGESVQVDAGAAINLEGGGDLYAYEFSPGPPDRSIDVLTPANAGESFAVIPWLSGEFAPLDAEYYAGTSGFVPGDSVYLSGVNGLPGGLYARLPARYALLDGAWLATPVSGFTDLPASTRIARPDGSQIVSGYGVSVTDGATMLREARTSGYALLPGAQLHREADYGGAFASRFFSSAGNRLPQDAGRLVFDASRALAVNGQLRISPGSGGRGAEVDIVSGKIAIASRGATGFGNDVAVLDSASLSNLNAASLLIGGTRTTTDRGTEIDVRASEVTVANSGSDPLHAPEVLLVASDRVIVADGAVVEGTGNATLSNDALVIKNDTAGVLRVSSGGQVDLIRPATSSSTQGVVEVRTGAVVTATGAAIFDGSADVLMNGTLDAGKSLALGASRITLGEAPAGTSGLILDNAALASLQGLEALALRATNGTDFRNNSVLEFGNLTLDTSRIGGYGDAASTTELHATGDVRLQNLSNAVATGTPDGVGALRIETDGQFILGDGNSAVAGFSAVTLAADDAIHLDGKGALDVGAKLTLEAPRLTAATRADVSIAAATDRSSAAPVWHELAFVRPASVTSLATSAADGLAANAQLLGKNVTIASDIVLPSGQLTIAARGADANDDVVIATGADLQLGGVEIAFADVKAYAPGGKLTLDSDHGSVRIATGADVNLAGARDGDGGTLEINARAGTADIAGNIAGGSAAFDVQTLTDFSALNAKLNASAFNSARKLTVGNGDIVVAATDVVRAHDVQFVADNGAINVHGTIDASGEDGGRVELWAAGDVALHAGALVDVSARGAGEDGGHVLLATAGADGASLRLASGSTIKLDGGENASDGELWLRAPRTATGVAISDLDATIVGADRVVAEAFVVQTLAPSESLNATSGFDTSIAAGTRDALVAELDSANAGAGLGARLHLLPGVEIRSAVGAASLDVSGTLDLSALRAAGEAGVLTIRSAGDLNVNASISDGFDSAATSGVLFADGDSWSYRLAAGAKLDSANPLSVSKTNLPAGATGKFTLAADQRVRTGTGSIDIAAAGDIKLAAQTSVIYTAGHDAPVLPATEFSLPVSAAYSVNGGDLRLRAGGNFEAAESNQLITEWQYRQGFFNTDGAISSRAAEQLTWYTRFDRFEQGVGAFGGGNLDITVDGDISNLSAVVPSTARLAGEPGTVPDADRLTEFGDGTLQVRAGGDILSGLYYVDGSARIEAGGAIRNGRSVAGRELNTLLALNGGTVQVQARGDVAVEAVFNPTLVTQSPDNLRFRTGQTGNIPSSLQRSYFLTYDSDSTVGITSLGGDIVNATNIEQNLLQSLNPRWRQYQTFPTADLTVWQLYPANVSATALTGSVTIGAPVIQNASENGGLQLLAGESVHFNRAVTQSDLPATLTPGPLNPFRDLVVFGRDLTLWPGARFHADPPRHQNDTEPSRVVALHGDVEASGVGSAALRLAEATVIEAGRDIRDVAYIGQNLRDTDVTRIRAGRDIVFTTPFNGASIESNSRSIVLGGPGAMELTAGRNVDLGSSIGVLSRGNLDNPFLPGKGANITVQAGLAATPNRRAFIARYLDDAASAYRDELLAYVWFVTGDETLTDDTARARFETLSADQQSAFLSTVFLSELRESGREATDVESEKFGDYGRGIEAITLMYPGTYGDDPATPGVDTDGSAYQGDIRLFFSQIKTEQNGGIRLLAPGGIVNAGLATASGLTKGASQLGIVTVAGGPIEAFVWRDFLVNQARVFTLQGGDILLWASKGNIDAGRGARTATATPPPRLRVVDGQVVLDLTNAISGSGIGALRANPDTPASDVFLFAPEGIINAGEAGIRVSGNLTLGAREVIGADVIDVGGTSVGVPSGDAGSGGASLAALGGVAAGAAKSAEESGTSKRAVLDDAGNVSIVEVKVLGFGDAEGPCVAGDTDCEKRKKAAGG